MESKTPAPIGIGKLLQAVEGEEGALWNTLMDEYLAAWEIISPKIRDTARGTLKEMTDLVSDALAYSVVKTLPDTHLHIDVRDMVPSRLRYVSNPKFIAGLADVTQSELQPYMIKLIREHGRVIGRYRLGSPEQVESDMRRAMDRVWRAVVDLDGEGVGAQGDRNADVS